MELMGKLKRYGGPPCERCKDVGVIRVKYGLTYETDTAEEIALAWREEVCPKCGGAAKQVASMLLEISQALDEYIKSCYCYREYGYQDECLCYKRVK